MHKRRHSKAEQGSSEKCHQWPLCDNLCPSKSIVQLALICVTQIQILLHSDEQDIKVCLLIVKIAQIVALNILALYPYHVQLMV